MLLPAECAGIAMTKRALTSVLALVLALSATPSGTTRATAGGTLRIVLADAPDARDPHRSQRPVGWLFARLLHRGLYAFPNAPYPAGANPVVDVATALPVFSADGLTATIAVRSGLRFSDGSAATAEVMASSLRRFVGARNEVARTVPLESVEAVGPSTLRVTLRRPAFDLAWLLAHPSAAIVPSNAPVARGTLPGLGPYEVKMDVPDARTTLVRNPNWKDDPVRDAPSDEILLTVKSSPAAAFDAVRTGAADMVGEPGPPDRWVDGDRAPLEAASRCVRLVLANHRIAPLNDPVVRRRLARRMPGAAAGAWTSNPLPPIIAGGGGDPRPPIGEVPRKPNLTLVATTTPRDRADAAAIRRAIGPVASIRILLVAPERLGGVLTSSSRPALALFTWCGAVPGLGGAALIEPLFAADGFAPRSSVLSRQIGAARAAVNLEVARERWKTVARTLAREALVMASAVIPERGGFGSSLVDPIATPMFPQGDPANMRRR